MSIVIWHYPYKMDTSLPIRPPPGLEHCPTDFSHLQIYDPTFQYQDNLISFMNFCNLYPNIIWNPFFLEFINYLHYNAQTYYLQFDPSYYHYDPISYNFTNQNTKTNQKTYPPKINLLKFFKQIHLENDIAKWIIICRKQMKLSEESPKKLIIRAKNIPSLAQINVNLEDSENTNMEFIIGNSLTSHVINLVHSDSDDIKTISFKTKVLFCSKFEIRTYQTIRTPHVPIITGITQNSVKLFLQNMSGITYKVTLINCSQTDNEGKDKRIIYQYPVINDIIYLFINNLDQECIYLLYIVVYSENDYLESETISFITRNDTIWNKLDHEILEVDINASRNAILKAYYKKALEYHPDKQGDVIKMQRLNVAKDRMLEQLKNRNEKINITQSKIPIQLLQLCYVEDEIINREYIKSKIPIAKKYNKLHPNQKKKKMLKKKRKNNPVKKYLKNIKRKFHQSFEKSNNSKRSKENEEAESGTINNDLIINCMVGCENIQQPLFKIVYVGVNSLKIEGSNLDKRGTITLEKWDIQINDWKEVISDKVVQSATMIFTLDDLEENHSYCLRICLKFTVSELNITNHELKI